LLYQQEIASPSAGKATQKHKFVWKKIIASRTTKKMCDVKGKSENLWRID
jgi:hypothetical protein